MNPRKSTNSHSPTNNNGTTTITDTATAATTATTATAILKHEEQAQVRIAAGTPTATTTTNNNPSYVATKGITNSIILGDICGTTSPTSSTTPKLRHSLSSAFQETSTLPSSPSIDVVNSSIMNEGRTLGVEYEAKISKDVSSQVSKILHHVIMSCRFFYCVVDLKTLIQILCFFV